MVRIELLGLVGHRLVAVVVHHHFRLPFYGRLGCTYVVCFGRASYVVFVDLYDVICITPVV